MLDLSQQDRSYLQKVASGRIKTFGWLSVFGQLAPAVGIIAFWVGFFSWNHHKLPEGTRLVICLWDGKRYEQPPEDLLESFVMLGFLCLLLVGTFLAMTTHLLRAEHNRLIRISRFLYPLIGPQPVAPPNSRQPSNLAHSPEVRAPDPLRAPDPGGPG